LAIGPVSGKTGYGNGARDGSFGGPYTQPCGVQFPGAPIPFSITLYQNLRHKSMNKLKIEKQETAITALLEGCSIRSVERMTNIHRDTIMRLLVRVGDGCQRIMDKTMRDLPCRFIQVDEIWAYVGKKQRHLTNIDDSEKTGNI